MEDNIDELSKKLYKSKWGKQLVPPKYSDAISVNSLIICDKCNKEFKNKYALWLHRKTCLEVNSNSETTTETTSETNSEARPNMTRSDSNVNEIVIKLLKQNKELLNKNMELIDKNKNLTDKIIEPLQSKTTGNTFNLNFYINNNGMEQVNTDEFITSVKSEIKQLEGLDKPVDVSNIITKQLDIPITDIKRKPIYTKSDSSWIKEKETEKETEKEN